MFPDLGQPKLRNKFHRLFLFLFGINLKKHGMTMALVIIL